MGLTEILGLVFIVGFFALMLVFSIRSTGSARRYLRDIPAFAKLGRSIGIAVEAGQRLHIGLGHGGIDGELGASTLVGLSMLKRIARAASISDRPPVATSGEAVSRCFLRIRCGIHITKLALRPSIIHLLGCCAVSLPIPMRQGSSLL